MSDYSFSAAERWAVYKIHGEQCYLCRKPIDLRSMQVDHIIPEYLLNDSDHLSKCLDSYGLPSNFNLNSYENWMPACASCNNKKSSDVFEPTPIFQIILQNATAKADQARKAATEAVSSAALTRALNAVERSAADETLDIELLKPLILAYAKARPKAMKALITEVDSHIIEFKLEFAAPPEFRITPFYKVLYTSGAIRIVQTPWGTGYVPTEENPHSSFYCGHCGSKGPWNGARCLSCGMLDDGD
ncbi:HNH endonuclease signature motif containing protein [Mesorhizobium sp. B2-5-3]|uniref:HNH endonuclease n=1 Tax=Mesorhizobium sp. B2-5-3 TaxID=2589927 RepID=UPI00112D6A64|nr:HNH endonuclease signature motif containing protein [Mesorhizobium sp. B2-5-3]TPK36362.1 HNH endonuclease [Mesorhizobium sp. B2-5-3]